MLNKRFQKHFAKNWKWNLLQWRRFNLECLFNFSSSQHFIFLFFISLHVCILCLCHIIIYFGYLNEIKIEWSSYCIDIWPEPDFSTLFRNSAYYWIITFPDAIVFPPLLRVSCWPSFKVICLFILRFRSTFSPGITISLPSKEKQKDIYIRIIQYFPPSN